MKSTIRFTVAGHPRSLRRNALSLLAGLAVLTTGALAQAKGVALYVEGPRAAQVREALVDDVPGGVTVVEAQAFQQALANEGQTTPFGKLLDGEGKEHEASVKRVHDAASSIGLTAVLVAQIAKHNGKWRVTLWVVPASGEEQGPEEVALNAGADPKRDSDLKATVGEMLASYKDAAPSPSPPPGASPSSPAESAPAASSGEDHAAPKRPHGLLTRSMLDVEVGAHAAGRHFDYNDEITSNLRRYDLMPVALASASFEVFPLADEKGVLRDIGLIGSYTRSLFLASTVGSSGVSIHTVESSIAGGVRVRIHPWGDDGPIIGVSDAYTSQAVTFDSSGSSSVDDQVPSVNYQANRFGVDGRIPLGRFALMAGAGFRAVVDAGAVAQRFRMTTAEGVDAELGLSMAVVPGWEARLLGDYERYFYSFGPIPGDAYVAGGALDQFYGATLAVAYIF